MERPRSLTWWALLHRKPSRLWPHLLATTVTSSQTSRRCHNNRGKTSHTMDGCIVKPSKSTRNGRRCGSFRQPGNGWSITFLSLCPLYRSNGRGTRTWPIPAGDGHITLQSLLCHWGGLVFADVKLETITAGTGQVGKYHGWCTAVFHVRHRNWLKSFLAKFSGEPELAILDPREFVLIGFRPAEFGNKYYKLQKFNISQILNWSGYYEWWQSLFCNILLIWTVINLLVYISIFSTQLSKQNNSFHCLIY